MSLLCVKVTGYRLDVPLMCKSNGLFTGCSLYTYNYRGIYWMSLLCVKVTGYLLDVSLVCTSNGISTGCPSYVYK